MGPWNMLTNYGGWEAVTENGTLYFALQPNAAQDPMYSPTYWQAAGVNPGAVNQWLGNQKFSQLNSNTFYVSAYSSIQGAINSAVSIAGQATVIDDRTANYSGPGFYVVDGITVVLASVAYNFTAPTTYNNGNNNVTAAIVLDRRTPQGREHIVESRHHDLCGFLVDE